MKQTIFVLLAISISACGIFKKKENKTVKQDEKKMTDSAIVSDNPPFIVGGPCTYNFNYIQLSVVAIKPLAPEGKEVVFVTQGSSIDTFLLSEVNGQYLTPDNPAFNTIKIGSVATLQDSRIASGTCTPFMKEIILKSPAECQSANEARGLVAEESNIPFSIAQNYFVNNTFTKEQLTESIIDNELKFSSIFGMAAFMGPDGTPTAIDFNTQFVIPIIGDITDINTQYIAQKLVSKDGNLTLTVELKEGEKMSSTMRPALIVIVNKKYLGKVAVEMYSVK